jgi:hypothetical protein
MISRAEFFSFHFAKGWELNVHMDKSAHAAKICVGVMLRAANTAVHALIAEISPWMVGSPVRKFAPRQTTESLVWFTMMVPYAAKGHGPLCSKSASLACRRLDVSRSSDV